MITFKCSRDQARMIDEDFLNYMIMNAKAKVNSYAGNDGKYLNRKIVLSLLLDIQLSFKRKLLGTGNKLNFSLSDAHGAAFYVYLMKRPVDPVNVYATTLRQQLCDGLHQQLFFNRPLAHEGVPVTEVDYELGE